MAEFFEPILKIKVSFIEKKGPVDLSVFEKNWGPLAMNTLVDHARKIKDNFVNTIKNNPILTWPPLSPRYLAWKKRKGYDERIYIATSELINDVGVRVIGGKKTSFFGLFSKETPVKITVGPSTGTHSRAKMSYEKLWRILEYGAFTGKGYIPPRPIWRPMMYEYAKLIKTHSRKMSKDITEKLKKLSKQGGTSGVTVRVDMDVMNREKV